MPVTFSSAVEMLFGELILCHYGVEMSGGISQLRSLFHFLLPWSKHRGDIHKYVLLCDHTVRWLQTGSSVNAAGCVKKTTEALF